MFLFYSSYFGLILNQNVYLVAFTPVTKPGKSLLNFNLKILNNFSYNHLQ